jgi:transposase
VVGIDDWAFKKGRTYGTIVVDMEKHRVIDLLPDRETETVKRWLEKHPSIEIVSRDRASGYAQAATQGAPQAVQVADRWHLLKNLGDTLQRVLETQRSAMKEAAQTVAQALAALPTQEVDRMPESPPADPVVTVHQQLYEQVKAHQLAGKSISWVATHLTLSRHTVRKYWSWDTYQPKASRRWSPLCRYEAYLQRRWQQGQYPIETLFAELQEQGYQGSVRTVYRAMSRYKGGKETEIRLPPSTDYSPRQVSFWLSRLSDELPSQAVKEYMEALFLASPLLKRVGEVALIFKELMAKKQVDKLEGWLVECEELGVDVLSQFVRGLRQDYAAVRQAFCSDWSNGQVEGQVNRLKTIKRQMYGRAGLDLLRRRVVIPVG